MFRTPYLCLVLFIPSIAAADASVNGYYRDTYVKGGIFELPKDDPSRSAFEYVPPQAAPAEVPERSYRKQVLFPGKFSKSTRGVEGGQSPESAVWEIKPRETHLEPNNR